MDGFDAEQIWLQLDQATVPHLKRVRKLLRKAGSEPRLLLPNIEEDLEGGWARLRPAIWVLLGPVGPPAGLLLLLLPDQQLLAAGYSETWHWATSGLAGRPVGQLVTWYKVGEEQARCWSSSRLLGCTKARLLVMKAQEGGCPWCRAALLWRCCCSWRGSQQMLSRGTDLQWAASRVTGASGQLLSGELHGQSLLRETAHPLKSRQTLPQRNVSQHNGAHCVRAQPWELMHCLVGST